MDCCRLAGPTPCVSPLPQQPAGQPGLAVLMEKAETQEHKTNHASASPASAAISFANILLAKQVT